MFRRPSSEWGRGGGTAADLGQLARRVQRDSRPLGSQSGQRVARPSQQVGAPGTLFLGRCLPCPGTRCRRLLTSISAPQVREIDAHKQELLRVRFQEQVRGERRRTGTTVAAAGTVAGLKAWRDVVTPHQDVASGRYQQAEFAADLWQVFLGEGTDEYRDPAEFFRRTYLTASLRQMLVGAVQRLTGRRRRPGGTTADQLRRWQDPLDAGAVPPVLRRAADQSGRHRRGAEERRHCSVACRAPRRAGRKSHLAGQPGHQAGRHRGAHPLGRAGVAARRTGSVRACGCRRRACHQSRGPCARAARRVRAVPGTDRRVGRLRPAVARTE